MFSLGVLISSVPIWSTDSKGRQIDIGRTRCRVLVQPSFCIQLGDINLDMGCFRSWGTSPNWMLKSCICYCSERRHSIYIYRLFACLGCLHNKAKRLEHSPIQECLLLLCIFIGSSRDLTPRFKGNRLNIELKWIRWMISELAKYLLIWYWEYLWISISIIYTCSPIYKYMPYRVQ